MTASGFNEDFLDVLRELGAAGVQYVIVGAHALAVHGVPRATGDLDVFVRPTLDNSRRVVAALRAFGAPLDAHGITDGDFCRPGTVYQLGLPPRRIDVLTAISGVSFDEAWATRVEVQVGETPVAFLGRESLLRNKVASGRPKDLADLEILKGRPR